MMKVLVPSTGNLYIYEDENFINLFEGSSRPLHGESIYLQMARNWSAYEAAKGSRPLHGESIYLHVYRKITVTNARTVLVPSTGNLYIYGIVDGERYWITTFSSPPRGIYISTELHMHLYLMPL